MLFDGDLDDCNWAVADLESTSRGACVGHARDIRESIRCIQKA